MIVSKIKNTFRKLSLGIMTIIIGSSMCIPSFAVTEHSFGYQHPQVSYYSSYRQATYTLSALNTYSPDALPVHNTLVNNGYYNASAFYNNSASPVRNSIGSDAIFYITAHGGAGRVNCV